AAAMALLVGLIQIAAGAMRLGFMAQFLSKPILLGYVNGVAGIIIVGQLGKLLGLDIASNGFFPRLWENVTEVASAHWPTVALSVGLLAAYLLLRRFAPRVPAGLVTVTVAVLASVTLDLEAHGVAVVGDVASGIPLPALPSVGFERLSALVVPAAGMALVGFADAAAITRVYAKKHGYAVEADRELLGLGTANVVAGVTSAVPVGSSGSRTAVNDDAGGASPVVSIVVAAVTAAVALFATALVEPLPSAALGVVIVGAALGLVDFGGVRRLRRVHDTEAGLALAALLGVLALNVLGGLMVAIALSAGVFVYRSIRPHDAVLGSVSDVDGYRDIVHHPKAALVEGMVVYRFDAPLYFPNAQYFTERAMSLADPAPRWFVLNCEAVTYIDASGIEALENLRDELSRQGTVLVVARARADLRRMFDRTGLARDLPVYRSVRAAAEAFRRRGEGSGGGSDAADD
ncbi:SulP family inorganic anion transporter, partial [Glycomyces tenuis]